MLAETLWAQVADSARIVATARKGEFSPAFVVEDPSQSPSARVGLLLRAHGYFPLWLKRNGKGVRRPGYGLYISATELGISPDLDLGARIVGAMAAAEVFRVNRFSCSVAVEIT